MKTSETFKMITESFFLLFSTITRQTGIPKIINRDYSQLYEFFTMLADVLFPLPN